MTNQIYINQQFQHQQFLLSHFNKSDKLIIFDVGACDGLDSIKYSNLFENSLIYSFEPLVDNVKEINKNIKIYNKKNIQCFQLALGKDFEIKEMYISSGHPPNTIKTDWNFGNKSSSLYKPKEHLNIHKWVEFNKTQKVCVNTLSNVMNSLNVDNIDILHLDTQGSELDVLIGAKNKIDNIKVIWIEIEKIELYENQPLINDIEDYLVNKDFIKLMDTSDDVAGDQLWIKKTN